jgi:hypothetical protein
MRLFASAVIVSSLTARDRVWKRPRAQQWRKMTSLEESTGMLSLAASVGILSGDHVNVPPVSLFFPEQLRRKCSTRFPQR